MTSIAPITTHSVPGISRRDMYEAEGIARTLPDAFRRRNLTPAFSGFYLSRVANMTLLIAPLDTTRIGDQSRYTSEGLLHQLSTEFGDRLKRRVPVYKSNTAGVRYVVVLSSLAPLPEKIDLPPGIQRGHVAIGQSFAGSPLSTTWNRTPHWAVMGMTGAGKSMFLRLLVHCALQDEAGLLLSDMDQTTFPMLEGHPALLAPIAATPEALTDLLRQALGECDHRAVLFKAMPGYPADLAGYNALAVQNGREPLRRVVVILDEFSSIMQLSGRSTGDAAQVLSALGWRGRKFGLHLIFAGQDFTKDLIGPVREQSGLSICFRVKPGQAQIARNLGCRGAHNIPADRPGLAICDRFGPFQAYFTPKELLVFTPGRPGSIALDETELRIFTNSLENNGRVPLVKIMEWGALGQGRARALQEDWERRGWIAKDPSQDNAFTLTERGKALIPGCNPANLQTLQTPANCP